MRGWGECLAPVGSPEGAPFSPISLDLGQGGMLYFSLRGTTEWQR